MSNPTPPPPGSASGPDRGTQPGSSAPGQTGGTTGATGRDAGRPPAEDKKSKKAQKSKDKSSDPLRRSRAGGLYLGVIALGIVLVLLIIFVTQNTDPTTVRFLVWESDIPVAVALLIAAVAGLFLAGIAASMRILQLRRRVKHDRKA